MTKANGQQAAQEEFAKKQRRHDYHTRNLQQGGSQRGETAEVLRALSEVDDLPIDPQGDRVMGQLVSKLTSTTYLTAEQVRSNEWVREYIMLLYLCRFPTHDGMHGTWRGFAHGDADAEREPLDPTKRMELEAYVANSKLALNRSEDAKAMEESTRTITESYAHDDSDGDSGSGGILGRIRS